MVGYFGDKGLIKWELNVWHVEVFLTGLWIALKKTGQLPPLFNNLFIVYLGGLEEYSTGISSA